MGLHKCLIALLVAGVILTNGCVEKECETGADCLAKDCFTAECIENKCYYKHISNCCGNELCEPSETYETCYKDCPNCDDANECTVDSYDYHEQECVHKPVIPCCGNGICDKNVETRADCPTDCPVCDDSDRLTADSFNYETQECESVITHYFIDDFEGGFKKWGLNDEYGWPSKEVWSAVVEDNNTVLRGVGHSWATLLNKEWSDYAFKTKFKRIKGNIHINFRRRHNPPTRYMVTIAGNGNIYISLDKRYDGDADIEYRQLGGAKNIPWDQDWHALEIRGYGNIINVLVDDELLIKYKDTDDPFLSGGVAFETLGKCSEHKNHEEAEFSLDDVEITVISESDVE